MSEVCVSGATGFVGRHLLDRLSGESDIVTVGLSRRVVDGSRVRFVQGDLSDRTSVESFVSPGSVVVHLAYSRLRGFDNGAAAEMLAQAAIAQRASAFIYVSTAVVVGRCADAVIDESTPGAPSSPYERQKLDTEARLIEILSGSMRLCILRPTAIFGPGGRNLLSLLSFIRRAPRFVIGARMSIMGKRRMNLVAVENVAEAIHHAIRTNVTGPLIVADDHVPGNHYTNVAQRLMEGLGMPSLHPRIDLSFALGPALRISGRSLSNPATIFSAERLRATGYRPAVDFDDAVRRFAKAEVCAS